MKNYLLSIVFIFVLVSCNGGSYKFDEQNKVILLKYKNYEIYTSKKLFSENLKNWITKYPDIIEDKKLLLTFENNKGENSLDLEKLTSESYIDNSRLKFRIAEMLESNDAYVFNLKTHTHESIKIDSTFTNHFFTVRTDTLFITMDRVY